jgi:transposase
MPAERIPMRKVRDTLRLRAAGLSMRQIAASLVLSIGAVCKYLELAAAAGLSWPLPEGLDDAALERALFGQKTALPSRPYTEPDYAALHTQLKRKGVTLRLLWEEYREAHPFDSYQFTQFTVRFRAWQAHLKTSMRQTHTAGEKMFVDYAGPTVPVCDAAGQVRYAQIFVAVLGASNYTYAEATWTQQLPDWIGSHCRAFSFFGGVSALVVPDNLLSGVTKPDRYDPVTNRTYQEMAEHYGTAVLPARPRKPRDKAKVEVGVQIVERWILARLRNQRFTSLSELNAEISRLLVSLNERPFKKLPGCRRSLFDELEREALRPLPDAPFVYGEWRRARVGIDYHLDVDGHFYSVPFSLARRVMDVRVTGTTVEIFDGSRRVASHQRSRRRGGHSTVAQHMPKAHRAHAEWSPARLLEWAGSVGPSTHRTVEHIFETRPHPEHGYRACLGLQRLAKRYDAERLEAACRRALAVGSPTRESIESILKLGLDRIPMAGEHESQDLDLMHENVRGADYYRAGSSGEEVLPC